MTESSCRPTVFAACGRGIFAGEALGWPCAIAAATKKLSAKMIWRPKPQDLFCKLTLYSIFPARLQQTARLEGCVLLVRQFMTAAPTISFRFRSTAPMLRLECPFLLLATSNVAIAGATAHCDILCPITVCPTSAAAHSILTAHVAAGYRRHYNRWAQSRVQLP